MKQQWVGRLAMGLLLAVGLLLAGCGGEQAQVKQRPAPLVRVEAVAVGPFAREVRLTGTVEATTLASLSSPAEGPIFGLRCREGDVVAAGEVLLSIGRDSSVEAALAAALEEQARTEREYERVTQLVERGAMARERLDVARAALERARAQVVAAQQATRDYVITAPWPGVVAHVHVADGRYVGPRTPLIDMYDPDSLVLRFAVTEEQAFAVREGDRILARFDATPDQEYELRVIRAWPELDRRMRMRTFEAALPDGGRGFIPGQFARLRLLLDAQEAAITVAEEALLPSNGTGQQRVMVVDADNKISLREVQAGFSNGGRRLITAGLEPGERVVVAGMAELKAGQSVRVQVSGRGQP